MKKSTILLLSALAFFLCCLTAFNFALTEEYKTGRYKEPFRDYKAIATTGFDAVEVNGAGKINVIIKKGPFGVKMHNEAQEYLQLKQQGSTLVVEVNQKKERQGYIGQTALYITCPQLVSLATTSTYQVQGKSETQLQGGYYYYKVMVEGFTQDSMQLKVDQGNGVVLLKNTIGKLTAVAGATPGSSSKLTISANNTIKEAHFDIRHLSTLELENVMIPSGTYAFSDSARANFSGKALQVVSQK